LCTSVNTACGVMVLKRMNVTIIGIDTHIKILRKEKKLQQNEEDQSSPVPFYSQAGT